MRCQLHSAPCQLGSRITGWQQINVLLSNFQFALAGQDLCVFSVLVIEGGQLPISRLSQFLVLELGDLTEDGNLLDEGL